MSSMLDALNSSMQKSTPKTLFGQANLVGKLIEFVGKSIRVEIMNGDVAGQIMDIDPGEITKSENFSKPSKAQTSSYTQAGGMISFDRVVIDKKNPANADGIPQAKATWANVFIRTPDKDNTLVTDAVLTRVDPKRNNKDGNPIVNLHVLETESEKKVFNLDDMVAELTKAFTSTRIAMIVDMSSGEFKSGTTYLPGNKTEDGYVHSDPAEFAQKMFSNMDDEQRATFEKNLSENGITIVPVRNIQIGPRTNLEIKKAQDKAAEAGKEPRITSINPAAYETARFGLRLKGALMRTGDLAIPDEHVQRLNAAFLAWAPESAKEDFHKGEWGGVSDTDITDFFTSKGIALSKSARQNWNVASIHLQTWMDSSASFAAKTHEESRYALPFPKLECTKGLRATYGTEMTHAVRALLDTLSSSATKAVEKEVVAPIVTAAENDANAAAEADIDDLLNFLGEEAIGDIDSGGPTA